MPQQDKPESSWVSLRDTFDWTYFIFGLHAVCLWPFLRSGWGRSKPGVTGLIACFIGIPLYATFVESEFLLFTFWKVWLAAVGYRRIENAVLRWWGREIHSHYEGYPWLAGRVMFWVKDEGKLLAAEPLLCVILGVMLMPYDVALSNFVMLGFVSLGAIEFLYRVIESKRRTVVIDQRIEMRREAEMQQGRW